MDKVLLVTGGSRGIGAATALLAAEKGYAVAINYYQNKEAAEKIANEINTKGGKAIPVAGDVSVEADVMKMFQMVEDNLGPLTALVNNAGILDRQTLFKDTSAERLQRIFAINVYGSFFCAREAIKRMLHHGKGGAIVNVSSAASKYEAAFEYVDYAASKGAVDVMTMGLAKEVGAENIRVNAVRPGLIYTDIHATGGEPGRVDRLKDIVPMKRGGQPEEVAKTILWLLSDEASYITGMLVDITGGR